MIWPRGVDSRRLDSHFLPPFCGRHIVARAARHPRGTAASRGPDKMAPIPLVKGMPHLRDAGASLPLPRSFAAVPVVSTPSSHPPSNFHPSVCRAGSHRRSQGREPTSMPCFGHMQSCMRSLPPPQHKVVPSTLATSDVYVSLVREHLQVSTDVLRPPHRAQRPRAGNMVDGRALGINPCLVPAQDLTRPGSVFSPTMTVQSSGAPC